MTRNRILAQLVTTFVGISLLSLPARGQVALPAPLASYDVDVHIDSGKVGNRGDTLDVIYQTTVESPGATWLRLAFGDVELAGDIADGTASYLRITSLHDGAFQMLNAQHLQEWRYTSAYFNGDTVEVELLAHPRTGANRVAINGATAGIAADPETICGAVDDRQLSDDPRNARAVPIGCTAWLFDDRQHCFLTAGHCAGGSDVIEFNVPLSDGNGALNHPPPDDQYASDPASFQSVNGGVGNDWGYFGCFPNSNTGLTPYEAQGDSYILAAAPPPVQGQNIRITGYGTVGAPVSPTWNQVQKTHVGPYNSFAGTTVTYVTDTTGGNSGSPIVDETTGLAIGIHTHGGCTVGGGSNQGTAISHPNLQTALANPQGICAAFVGFEFPNGLPTLIDPAGGTTVTVQLVDQGAAAEPGTGVLHVDIGNGFVAFPMNEIETNLYEGTFPGGDCGSIVQYYFSAESTDGGEFFDPRNAPAATHAGIAATELVSILADNFEQDMGWTVTDEELSTGSWDRGVPATGGSRGEPAADFDGSGSCVVTGNTADEDVDGGPTRLTSPTIPGVGPPFATFLRYARWFTNDDLDEDRLDVEVSDDLGETWTLLESVPNTLGWVQKQWRLDDFVDPSQPLIVRFSATDNPNDSVTEAAVDAVEVVVAMCEAADLVLPNAFEAIRGMFVGGDLQSLFNSDNDDLSHNAGITVKPGEPPVQLLLTGTSSTENPATLSFVLESAVNTPSATQRLELWDYQAGAFEEVDVRATTVADTSIEISPGGDLSRFVQAGTGQMQARIQWSPPLLVLTYPWRVDVDQAIWRVTE